ncbi:MAG TPA: hemerythrin family protein [Anaeromyxobacter sp.]|nr:hemerythrin family protein [Anaeromyxobacter sp.]
MAEIDLARLPQLPIAFMNADHAHEVRLVNAVEAALAAHRRGEGTLGAVIEQLSLLAVHTREHFLREETAMREAGFAAYPAHKAEHDRVLAEMDAEARAFRDRGDRERLSRYLADALPAWFVNHIRTMDAVTAAFLARQRGAVAAAP